MPNIKSQVKYVLAALALGFCFALGSYAQQRPPIVGGYKSIPADDAGAVAAAEFAVRAQGERQEISIELVRILSAARQTVQGTNFRLCIEADVPDEDEGTETKQFLVEVYKTLQDEFTLKSWKEQKCAK